MKSILTEQILLFCRTKRYTDIQDQLHKRRQNQEFYLKYCQLFNRVSQSLPNTILHPKPIDLSQSEPVIINELLQAVQALMQHVQRRTRRQRRFGNGLHHSTRLRNQQASVIKSMRNSWATGLKVSFNSNNPIQTSTRRNNNHLTERELIHFCSDLRAYLKSIAPGLRVSYCSRNFKQ